MDRGFVSEGVSSPCCSRENVKGAQHHVMCCQCVLPVELVAQIICNAADGKALVLHSLLSSSMLMGRINMQCNAMLG